MKQVDILACRNIHPTNIKDIKASLPISKTKHITSQRINAILWWIRNKDGVINDNHLLQFGIGTINGSKRREKDINSQKITHFLQQKPWHNLVEKILINPWQVFEYFLLDSLLRNQKQVCKTKKWTKIHHFKTSPEQDYDEKIDMGSLISWKNKKWKISHVRIGTQLTTTKSGANIRNIAQQMWLQTKKRMTIEEKSQNIPHATNKYYPKIHTPDIQMLVVVNGEINKKLNDRRYSPKNNFLFKAFKKWQEWWFWHEKWPIGYLSPNIQNRFLEVAKLYNKSLVSFTRFLQSKNHNPFEKLSKKRDFFSYYDAVADEFGIKHFMEDGSLLCSFAFFLNERVHQISQQTR